MKLQSRIFTDTTILLNYTDGDFLTTLELNRINKTICETSYDKGGKKYTSITFNAYHTEVGVYTRYDSLGNVMYVADNELGKAYTMTSNGVTTLLNKPKIVLDDEKLLIKKYGKHFVKNHIRYFPNDYFGYGFLDTLTESLTITKSNKSKYYTKGFKLILNDGNTTNAFLNTYFYDAVQGKEQIVACTNNTEFTKNVFCDSINFYYNKAKQFGLVQSKDYITYNFTNPCLVNRKNKCCGEMQLNLIEILNFDTTVNKQRVVYNAYSFNPWTRKFLGKTKTECTAEDFLFRVINFENEIYIHRFKDPLIPRPRYLDDIIKFYRFDNYKYIIE
ncbi:MAG: hypothetical protein KGZ37_10325 [Nitrosarchaeum sp.]|nr:hypothetical protein [Nitrosarchaeum sp.]